MIIDPVALLVLLVIGAIAVWLVGQIMRGGGFGIVGDTIVGIIGAIVAGSLSSGFQPYGGLVEQMIRATVGAIILLFVIGLLKRAT